MKRSEMVQLMEDAMIEWQDSYAKFGGKWADMFSFILKQQEEAGILAPGRIINDSNRGEYPNYTDAEFTEYCWQEEVHKWEPEKEVDE